MWREIKRNTNNGCELFFLSRFWVIFWKNPLVAEARLYSWVSERCMNATPIRLGLLWTAHSHPQRLCSIWSLPRIVISGALAEPDFLSMRSFSSSILVHCRPQILRFSLSVMRKREELSGEDLMGSPKSNNKPITMLDSKYRHSLDLPLLL